MNKNNLSLKEERYSNNIKSLLLENKISQVFYEELDYETDSEFWEYSNHIHSIDMNIILLLDNGELVQIKWDNEFYPYGLGLEKINQLNYRKGIKTIDVSSNHNWNNLLNNKIKKINVLWDSCKTTRTEIKKIGFIKYTKRKTIEIRLPQSWEIEFENSKLWISAIEITNENTRNFWADHLSVFFKREDALNFGISKNSDSFNPI